MSESYISTHFVHIPPLETFSLKLQSKTFLVRVCYMETSINLSGISGIVTSRNLLIVLIVTCDLWPVTCERNLPISFYVWICPLACVVYNLKVLVAVQESDMTDVHWVFCFVAIEWTNCVVLKEFLKVCKNYFLTWRQTFLGLISLMMMRLMKCFYLLIFYWVKPQEVTILLLYFMIMLYYMI